MLGKEMKRRTLELGELGLDRNVRSVRHKPALSPSPPPPLTLPATFQILLCNTCKLTSMLFYFIVYMGLSVNLYTFCFTIFLDDFNAIIFVNKIIIVLLDLVL